MTQEIQKTFGFKTGSICADSNLYRCSNGLFEVIEYVEAGTPFPSEPFGNGKNKINWTKLTLASEGGRTSLDGGNTTTSDTSVIAV